MHQSPISSFPPKPSLAPMTDTNYLDPSKASLPLTRDWIPSSLSLLPPQIATPASNAAIITVTPPIHSVFGTVPDIVYDPLVIWSTAETLNRLTKYLTRTFKTLQDDHKVGSTSDTSSVNHISECVDAFTAFSEDTFLALSTNVAKRRHSQNLRLTHEQCATLCAGLSAGDATLFQGWLEDRQSRLQRMIQDTAEHLEGSILNRLEEKPSPTNASETEPSNFDFELILVFNTDPRLRKQMMKQIRKPIRASREKLLSECAETLKDIEKQWQTMAPPDPYKVMELNVQVGCLQNIVQSVDAVAKGTPSVEEEMESLGRGWARNSNASRLRGKILPMRHSERNRSGQRRPLLHRGRGTRRRSAPPNRSGATGRER